MRHGWRTAVLPLCKRLTDMWPVPALRRQCRYCGIDCKCSHPGIPAESPRFFSCASGHVQAVPTLLKGSACRGPQMAWSVTKQTVSLLSYDATSSTHTRQTKSCTRTAGTKCKMPALTAQWHKFVCTFTERLLLAMARSRRKIAQAQQVTSNLEIWIHKQHVASAACKSSWRA